MGTRAVFAVTKSNGSRHEREIIGMARDGFPDNLAYLASLFCQIAREARVLTKIRKNDDDAVKKVVHAMVCSEQDQYFLDDFHNARFVDYSAEINPESGEVRIYEGKFSLCIRSFKLDLARAKTTLAREQILKALEEGLIPEEKKT